MRAMIKDPFQRLNLDREVLSVSQLNNRARLLLEDVFGGIWVEGEISNLAKPASGHIYFTLKDSQAQVRCALFRQNAAKVRQALRDGLAVKVRGKVSLFEGRGDYQLILDAVEPAGDGALRLAFEALKEKLSAEGLFAAEAKVALPAHPKRIGIISSPTGAVIRDIISVFRRRAPQVELTLIPTAVQGREATAQIVRALGVADSKDFDALILARGGGSLEDLWCFNEEAVARAIAACAIARIDPNINIPVVILSSIIIFIPGLALTLGLAELAARDLISGTARIMDASMLLFKLYFGAVLGMAIGKAFFGEAIYIEPEGLPRWAIWSAVPILSMALVFIFKARMQDSPWGVLAGIVAFFSAMLGGHFFGDSVGIFFGALAVGVYSNLYARWMKAPASIALLQGIVILVPGSKTYIGLNALISGETMLNQSHIGSQIFLIFMSLIAGLIFANVVVPPRRTL